MWASSAVRTVRAGARNAHDSSGPIATKATDSCDPFRRKADVTNSRHRIRVLRDPYCRQMCVGDRLLLDANLADIGSNLPIAATSSRPGSCEGRPSITGVRRIPRSPHTAFALYSQIEQTGGCVRRHGTEASVPRQLGASFLRPPTSNACRPSPGKRQGHCRGQCRGHRRGHCAALTLCPE